jgi:uncharacterized protein YjbJ (UPF0337 family)
MQMEVNKDILGGKWKQIRGKIREEWGELTDDDMDRVAGNYDQFVGVLQERYGHSREEAEQEVDEFLNGL